ncbi:hypothetical protein HanXRQr2_Chr03g0117321 [Helianthus annuus]|uniref:Uncharacterized protein n=1 Tax=Helianthus annuus TaxID=4232 RepID=A0A9K3JHE4_HELAN|nr:hypothetical protein HanXRQr2_Chr03g0117321 [Helianthus annuus]KAJ0944226.1 hypothetical protein HanPSC8_Chr03g0113851 [Helianthus annuus]
MGHRKRNGYYATSIMFFTDNPKWHMPLPNLPQEKNIVDRLAGGSPNISRSIKKQYFSFLRKKNLKR